MVRPRTQPLHDTLFRGASLIDGTGASAFRADLAISGDRIVAIGDLAGVRGVREIDARDKFVVPGFIDAHAHDDQACLGDPSMRAKISQGVTTVVVGNCGISLAPLQDPAELPEPFNLLGDISHFRFADFASYFDAVAQAKPATNVLSLVGHNTLRAATMANLDRRANKRELEAMLGLLEDAMRAGAAGLSTGVYYAPGRAADNSEIIPLVRKVASFGGVYASHVRDEYDGILESLGEACAAARTGGVPLIVSHHKCAGPRNWGRSRESLAFLDGASAMQEISLDCYPYEAGSSVLDSALVEEGVRVLVTGSRKHPSAAGQYLNDIASAWACSEREAVNRLHPGGACYFQMSEDDVRRILSHPAAMIGSDGLPGDPHPHPRLWGAFPRVIRRYAMEQGLFSVEAAVHKMTGMTADRFNIKGRGELAEGNYADIVVFDPQSIADQATYRHPTRAAAGIEHVFVNGTLSWGNETAGVPGAGAPVAQRANARIADGKRRHDPRLVRLGNHCELPHRIAGDRVRAPTPGRTR